ncbi:N-acetylneuraminate synthase family protein [Vibrio sp. 10N.261.52.C2]|uniref:N-acetylneuraminate synthase family protein n=1 Tax=Vibrio sp. 10N.261.52.C2 TaxID=3229681 RepID=UPI00354C7A2C
MQFEIGNKRIGDGCPTFIIAEVGSNHNQSFELALKHIDAAAEAGVDAVKFQTFKATEHVSKYAEMPKYLKGYENIHDLIKSLELNRDWQLPLKEYAESKGLIFFSSPCDYDAVDELQAINVPAHKVASFDLPDLDLVRYIAKTQKPILLSTGLADWMEIQRAVDVCREEGNNKIVLFQCTSLYPAPPHLSNLKSMSTMKSAFNVVTGYSDHTLGDNIPVASVALGASVIEKHFTLDRSLPGPDHAFAIEPDELKILVDKIREVESAIGNGEKNGPRPEEQDMYKKVRRSLHVSCDVEVGTVLTNDMLVSKRPGYGIPVHLKDQVIGRVATKSLNKDQWITWGDI